MKKETSKPPNQPHSKQPANKQARSGRASRRVLLPSVLVESAGEQGQGSLLWRYSMSCCRLAPPQAVLPLVLSIVALILLPLGISMIADAGLANVETDFIALGKVCNVTAIHHRSDTITSTNFAGQGLQEEVLQQLAGTTITIRLLHLLQLDSNICFKARGHQTDCQFAVLELPSSNGTLHSAREAISLLGTSGREVEGQSP